MNPSTPVEIPPTERAIQMKLTKKIGMILLGVWLILMGLIPILKISFEGRDIIMAILAIVAGAFILVDQ